MINESNYMNNIKISQISASSLSLYETCPYCWKLKYVYKLLQASVPHFLIGQAFHKGCELYHLGTPIDSLWEQLKNTYLDIKDKDSVERFSLIRDLVEFYLNHPLNLKTIESEKQFNLKIDEVPFPLFGFIDGIVEGGIKEYKTTSQDYKEEEIKTIQSKIYSYVYFKLFGLMPLVTYYVINKKKVKKPNYTPQILNIKYEESIIQEVEQYVKTFYDNIVNGKFEPNPVGHWGVFPGYCPTAYNYARK